MFRSAISYKYMQISWHGQYTVKLASKDTTIVLDPYSPDTGLTPFRAKADVAAFTNPDEVQMSHQGGLSDVLMIINSAGEYSLRGMSLYSIGWHDAGGHERSLMRWDIEGVTILHIGALNRTLTEIELVKINQTDIDVLLVPVGGGSGLNTKDALALVSTIEPRLVIPIHFKISGLKEKLEPVDQFAKEMGVSSASSEKKVLIRANRLPQDDIQTIILKP